MVFHKCLLSSIVYLVSLQIVSAVPTPDNVVQSYPELIPGPGLPSLESLNLTVAQLYEMGKPESSMSYYYYSRTSF